MACVRGFVARSSIRDRFPWVRKDASSVNGNSRGCGKCVFIEHAVSFFHLLVSIDKEKENRNNGNSNQ